MSILHLQEDGRTFIDMPDDPADNPCSDCGACCTHFRISFYAGEIDTQPMGFVPRDLVEQLTPFLAVMKGTQSGAGRCCALQGQVGQRGIGCGIYAHRPSVCREYPVWMSDGTPNPDCQRLRAQAGLPPLPHKP